jgi:hypothetical protein
MNGGKYNNACIGIEREVKELMNDPNANHFYTLIEFADGRRWYHEPERLHEVSYTHFTNKRLNEVGKINFKGSFGGTPLYRTLHGVLADLKFNPPNGKCIVKIFTDGQDTEHWCDTYKKVLSRFIRDSEVRGITITFMATQDDKDRIIRDLEVSEDNILVHDNTAQGVERSFINTTKSSMLFTKSMSNGASGSSLTSKFYSRTDEDANKGL